MASRRLNSDRFFTEAFTDDVYTPEGMQWVETPRWARCSRATAPSSHRTFDLPNAFGIWKRAEK